ncbi:MAG: transglycosylase domain-containing protein [Bacteroidales bacterium]|nr:transglycosylase domain-containing protein [Bacteroidales bacterium]
MTDDTKKKIIKWFWICVTAPFAMIMLMLILVWVFARIPSFEELEHPDNKLATQLLADDGRTTLTTFHIENRTYVTYEELSPYLVQAAVSTEDARFYNHSGIDMKGLGRVFFKTLLLHNSSQGGGSTITQQLAKTLYPRRELNSSIPGWSKVQMVWIKLKEWITAVKLERNYTKDEIMVMYLNSIFFGSNAYGIKAASQTFFGKLPHELSIEESAMLVGMVNKPTRYNPVLNPEKALQRRNFVIGQMEKAGCFDAMAREAGVKPAAVRDSLQGTAIDVRDYQVQDHNSGVAPYFRDMLRRTMNAKKPKRSDYQFDEDYVADMNRWENDDLYGWLNKHKKANGESYDLDKDGLRIYTTINYKMQRYAEQAVAEHLGSNLQKAFTSELRYKNHKPFSNDIDDETIDLLMRQARKWSDRYRTQKKDGVPEAEILKSFTVPTKMRVFKWAKDSHGEWVGATVDTTMTPDDSIRYYKGILRASFLAVEPVTGHVKAYVGGPNYRYFKYDNVSQGKRQVGSTIKPFLYTLAMQEGMDPCTKVTNISQSFIVGDDTWTPRSTDKAEWIGQTVTLKWGLAHSSNNISAYLMKNFGPEPMAQMMHKMGIQSHIDAVPSLCVGPADIAMYEMVPAFNTFPSKGVYVSPLIVTRIEDNQGNVLSEFTNRKREAISEQTAYLMANLMQGVVNSGTAGRLRGAYGLRGEIAGKTGTTNDNSDGWFIGYTPTLTAGVWVGAEDRQVHFQSLALGSGSNMALPIWGIFMKKVLKDGTLGISESDRFVAPAGMNLDLSCSGGDDDAASREQSAAEFYFE